jgi:hypothetical protein
MIDLVERPALDELHRDEEGVVDATEVEEAAHAGMRHAAPEHDLAAQSIDDLGDLSEIRREHLERDHGRQLEVEGLVHHAHRSATDLARDRVAGRRDGGVARGKPGRLVGDTERGRTDHALALPAPVEVQLDGRSLVGPDRACGHAQHRLCVEAPHRPRTFASRVPRTIPPRNPRSPRRHDDRS